MAFDDSSGGQDRRFFHHAPETIWGDDFGDRKPRRLADAARVCLERAQVDAQADEKIRARWEKIAADATRRRSAAIEAKIERDLLRNAQSSMGAAMLAATTKRKKANGREKPEKALE